MMTTALAAALTAGVDAGDAAQTPTPPGADGTSAFASALEALFADVAAAPQAAAPLEADAAVADTALAVDVPADAVEVGPAMPPIDPMILFGMPTGAPAPVEQPMVVDPRQWLRVALERSDADATTPASELGTTMTDAQGVRAERDVAAMLQHAAHGAGESVSTVIGAAWKPPEAGAVDVPTVEAFTPEGVPTVLTADPVAGAKPAADSSPRPAPPPVTVPMQSPEWSREFAARVNWMVDRGEQFASIQLTPEQLGPVEVRLAIREGEASIWFGAAQADTRAAIEQALPRLREMLAASGLALADAGVFQGSPRDPRHGLVRADARRAAGESAEPVQELGARYRRNGLIDDYA
jgi:flagellar hook-length control protein FliK